MTIPFLDLYNKAKARLLQARAPSAPAQRPVPVEKPSSERMSKTVLPNSTKVLSPHDPMQAAADSMSNIKLPSMRGAGPKLPPSVALALQPKVERAVSLQLCDLLDQFPAGYMKPVESFDTSQRILLKAAEIEKGMASGKPTVSLATIYAQVPEIFLKSVPPDDLTQVGLPFEKVLDQFQNVQVRTDQEAEQAVPQLDTPILQATIEDTQRFGTPMPPQLVASDLPGVKVEHATARAISNAEPEPAITLGATRPNGNNLRPSTSESVIPARIPFNLPPNGTGVSAPETVPASSGPPVPNPAAKNGGPVRIPFKMSAPSDDLKLKLALVPGADEKIETEQTEAEEILPAPAVAAGETDEVKIVLSLQTVMQNMPAFQVNGPPENIPSDVRVELPFSLVEPQLASGRVAVPAKMFRDMVPEAYRELFVVDVAESPVLLPLQEVLNHLPASALKMREDQEQIDAADLFETPFSIKAAEDARRFTSGAPEETGSAVIKPGDAPVLVEDAEAKVRADEEPASPLKMATKFGVKQADKAQTETKKKSDAKKEATLDAPKGDKGEAKKHEKVDESGAKQVVARASSLAGVAGCSITFADGLSLAGNLPEETRVEGLSAMAPSLLQRIDRHMLDTKLGPLTSMTLYGQKSPITFFMKGNVCLTVLHSGGDLAAETRNELAEITKELSRTYTQPETVHVDH
jgi:predicted regulator of Ras-like GTPase activity (Roadblock/LC7/MglB family)